MNIKYIARWIIIPSGLIAALFILFSLLGIFQQTRHAGLPLNRTQVNKLTKAAEHGDVEACWALYLYYVEDDRKEEYWLRKAVDYGYPSAQMHLAARLQFQGSEGKSKATELLNKAATQNYAYAQEELGQWYRDGRLVKQDLRMAEYWFRRAANNGSLLGMEDLVKLLMNTHQDYKTLVESYKWTEVALIRTPKNTGYEREALNVQENIAQKAKKLNVNMDRIKRTANEQALESERHIPIQMDAIEEQKRLIQNIRKKYGD